MEFSLGSLVFSVPWELISIVGFSTQILFLKIGKGLSVAFQMIISQLDPRRAQAMKEKRR